MSGIKSTSILCILLTSSSSISSGQELTFQREVDTISVIINGLPLQSPFAGGFRHTQPTLVDIDNDGDFDLFVGELDGNVNFYRNTGTVTKPSFTLETSNFSDIDIGANSTPTFVDIDNDEDFDLFVGELDGNINFYRNTGTVTESNFTLVTQTFTSANVRSNSTSTFTDIDSDGDFDLFVGELDGNINFFRNTGTNTNPIFTLETSNFSDVDVGFYSDPTFADIDNDGDFDLIVGEQDGNINFFRNTGTNTNPIFTLETSNFSDVDVGFRSAPTFIDIDNDLDLDLFVGEVKGSINFFRNTGTATEPIFIPDEIEVHVSVDVGFDSTPTFADIDNDADLDLFVGEDDGNINFYRNTGTVTEPIFILETENFADINLGFSIDPTFADIDNDADLDLFVGEGDGNINFFRNTGTATNPIFTLETSNFANIDVGFVSTPTFADIDNDADLDLFVGEGDGNINFFQNIGTVTNSIFTLETSNLANIDVGFVSDPTFVDIDNDADLDLFVGEGDGNINFFQNIGTVTIFTFILETENLDSINVRRSSPIFVDIDNDGDFDLFVGEASGGLHFYRNITTDIVRGDINSDGRIDVADLVRVINIILSIPPEPTDQERTAGEKVEIEFIPLEYNYIRLAEEMKKENIPQEFVDTILTGWWTTCLEILPAKERARGRY